MKEKDGFDISIVAATQVMNIANWIGCFLYSIPQQCFSQKKILMGGFAMLVLNLLLVVLFIQINFNIGILVCIGIFLLSF